MFRANRTSALNENHRWASQQRLIKMSSIPKRKRSKSEEVLHRYNGNTCVASRSMSRIARLPDDNSTKAAAFLFIFFQLCYMYLADIVRRIIYLVNLHTLLTDTDRKPRELKLQQKRRPVMESSSVKRQERSLCLVTSRSFANEKANNDERLQLSDIQRAVVVSPAICEKVKNPIETNYVTTTFQMKNGGLKTLINEVSDEIRFWKGADGCYIVCCELKWSLPTKYRNYPSEIRLKNEIAESLRDNNRRICAAFDDDDALRRPLSGGVVEESVGKRDGCQVGVYRRYYPKLLHLAHKDACSMHEPVWKFNFRCDTVSFVDEALIGSVDQTTVVALNLIYVKF